MCTYVLKYEIISSVAMRWLLQIVLSNVYLCEGVKFSFLKTVKAHRKKKGEIPEFHQQELCLIIANFS